jgi:hypothetical protein
VDVPGPGKSPVLVDRCFHFGSAAASQEQIARKTPAKMSVRDMENARKKTQKPAQLIGQDQQLGFSIDNSKPPESGEKRPASEAVARRYARY